MSSPPVPESVGRYRILRLLGSGAMGDVYLAEDPNIGRQVALKTVRLVGDEQTVAERNERLLREAKAAGRLLHPNAVTLFDAGEAGGVLYLAFELVEGSDLSRRLRSAPPLTVPEVLRLAREVASALDSAHQQGIVHRDVKPGNILLTPGGEAKVADFGIARLGDQSTALTRSGAVVGSPQYMSPEQIRGEPLDGRSDLFSLGVVLYEMLSESRPFDGDTISTLVFQILSQEPVALDTLRPGLPPRLVALVHALLAKDRDQRVATGGEVVAELAAIEEELAAGVPASEASTAALIAPPPPPPPPVAAPPPPVAAPPPVATPPPMPAAASSGTGTRKVAGWLTLAAIAALALVAVAVWFLRDWLPSQPGPEPVAEETSAVAAGPPEEEADAVPVAEIPPPAGEEEVPAAVAEDAEDAEVAETPAREEAAPSPPPPVRPPPRARPAEPSPAPGPAPAEAAPSPAEEPAPEAAAEVTEEAPSAPAPAPVEVHREIASGLSLHFQVDPDDAIVLWQTPGGRPVVQGAARNFDPKHDEARSVNLPEAGEYLVILRKDGYPDYRIRVLADPARGSAPRLVQASLRALRRPAGPRLIVVRQAIGFSGYPAGTAVYVDNVHRGAAADYPGGIAKARNLQLEPGTHDVRLEPPGYPPLHFKVEVRPDARKKREVLKFR